MYDYHETNIVAGEVLSTSWVRDKNGTERDTGKGDNKRHMIDWSDTINHKVTNICEKHID